MFRGGISLRWGRAASFVPGLCAHWVIQDAGPGSPSLARSSRAALKACSPPKTLDICCKSAQATSTDMNQEFDSAQATSYIQSFDHTFVNIVEAVLPSSPHFHASV